MTEQGRKADAIMITGGRVTDWLVGMRLFRASPRTWGKRNSGYGVFVCDETTIMTQSLRTFLGTLERGGLGDGVQ